MPLRASSHPGSPNSPSCSALAWYSCWLGLSPWGESGDRTPTARTAALTRYRYATQPTRSHQFTCNIQWHTSFKWNHFPRYWPFVRAIHRWPVNSPHKGQWRGALMFSLICAWINGWVNNRDAGDLRRYSVHYDVTVMDCEPPGISKGTYIKYVYMCHVVMYCLFGVISV